MTYSTIQRRSNAVLVATVLGIGTAGLTFASPAAAKIVLDEYIEVAQCQPATGQDCPQSPVVRFSVLQGTQTTASFTANTNGCSDAFIRFNIDDYPQTDWLRVSPGGTVSGKVAYGRSGYLELSVTARGIEGGCNTGILNSWGGMVRIESVPRPTTAPIPTPTRAPVGFPFEIPSIIPPR